VLDDVAKSALGGEYITNGVLRSGFNDAKSGASCGDDSRSEMPMVRARVFGSVPPDAPRVGTALSTGCDIGSRCNGFGRWSAAGRGWSGAFIHIFSCLVSYPAFGLVPRLTDLPRTSQE